MSSEDSKGFERSGLYDDMQPVDVNHVKNMDTWESVPKRVEGPLWDNIEELDLSIRTYTCLRHAGINTVEELCDLTVEDTKNIYNLGRRSFEEILAGLNKNGLSLKDSGEG